MKLKTEVKLQVSDTQYTVKASDVSPETTLNTYLRDKLHLTATKKMCLEGGCGSCIVAVEEIDDDGNKHVFAVNSCLVSIFSCHGWKILDNDGIGNPRTGYHDIQKLLAENNGTQCGFCSSGMVMNMYALNSSGKKTKLEIENSFGGNLCRCTGFRPILTAFKQLAVDSDDIIDIDDLEDIKPCKGSDKCQNACSKSCKKTTICYNVGTAKWMKVYNLNDVMETLKTSGDQSYMLVAGNTARGVFPTNTTVDLYIDISKVTELTTYTAQEDTLILGGNMRITESMDLFRKLALRNPKFAYVDKMANHLDLVAHVPVRNIGTWAGNLMMKYVHHDFQSDLFLILETANSTLVIVDTDGNETRVTPENFLKVNMSKKVIKQIILPAYGEDYYYESYKIMPRAQNAHAHINAGFLLKIDSQGVVQSARIVYGAINPNFVHAKSTEELLKGKQLFDNQVLQAVLKSLDNEIPPDWVPPEPTAEFRQMLALNLFYKYVLSIAPPSKVSARNTSGASLLSRPVTNSTQQIYPKQDLFPLTQPIAKLEALAQTSGQAEYIIDMPDLPGQLHGVFVKALAIPGSTITSIDPTNALQNPEVVAFYSAKDIPGLNLVVVKALAFFGRFVEEELFCSGTVKYFSQPVGVLVATSHEAAISAANLVTVSTTPPKNKPLLSVSDVLKEHASERITHEMSVVAKTKGTDVKKVIKGEYYMGSQYHYHMENQTCLAVPTEDGLNVYAATQWMHFIQSVISQVLDMPSQNISVYVRRLGGAFGGKILRNSIVSAATALAAVKLNKPVRMWLNLKDNMEIIGKRSPVLTQYEVGVNDQGVIQYMEADHYADYGCGGNEPIDMGLVDLFQNCYKVDTWTFDTYAVATDTHANCYARSPGSFEGLGAVESIMDHIAYTLNLDPVEVRRANMDQKKYPAMVNTYNEILQSEDIDKRKADIKQYNKSNRWKKRGLSVVPMRWPMPVQANQMTLVSIYHLDGGVIVTHGGIEMGQGINTKAAQVCAYKLGIPLAKVAVRPSNTITAPNATVTGGSLTSEAVAAAVASACDVLLDRIKPIREKNPNASWEKLVDLCNTAGILLVASGQYTGTEPGRAMYEILGCCALEVEVDILTGKHEILRVDILEDVGQSMSPLVDIGQIEGGFIMGMGLYSSEQIVHSSDGRLLTNNTWTYKPPGVKDIPQDFRVRFLNNSLNPLGVLQSKGVAEPPTCLSIAFPLAMRDAMASARSEADPTASPWYPLDGPSTVENTLLNTLTDYRKLAL